MSSGLALFNQLLGAVRFALVVLAGIFAVFCVIDWMVRTRRLNLFGSLARFSRSKIDPILEPIERKVVRAGGNPASAPLWALAAVVVGGILLISVLDFIGAELMGLQFALRNGPRGLFALFVAWTFDFLKIALLVRVVSSWLPVSPYSKWIRWSYAVTEWFLKPLRSLIPALGPIDISPLIAYFLIGLIQGQVLRML
ncbi:MAG TPA: YggT family protein [Gemmatimonadaceae bacterium]|jgi:YggT family protein|nr:YggT family protein [Gemmatimonadaceae bacterium]